MTKQELTPTKDLTTLLDGIVLGRTLHDLEKQAGVSVQELMRLIQTNDGASLGFKVAREFSSYVIEDEITSRLRANMEAPESAVKNNALKIWADHMHKVLEARNAATYSGKAAINSTTPVTINTYLDLGGQKTIEGIYELRSEVVTEVPIADADKPGTLLAETIADVEAGNGDITTPNIEKARRIYEEEHQKWSEGLRAVSETPPGQELASRRAPSAAKSVAQAQPRVPKARVPQLVRDKPRPVVRNKKRKGKATP